MAFLNSLKAECLTDVYSFGQSAESLAYEVDGIAKIASNIGTESRLGKMIYCPHLELEMTPSVRIQSITFDKNGNPPQLTELKEQNWLLGLGSEFKKPLRPNLEGLLDVELREDLGLYYNVTQDKLFQETYTNLKIMFGIRSGFKPLQKYLDAGAKIKIGGLIPFGNASLGTIYGVSIDNYFRLGRKSSIAIDLYYDSYSQSFAGQKNIRQELGVMGHWVFRL